LWGTLGFAVDSIPLRLASHRSPVTHAARFSAAICRNQLDSRFPWT
jgi:hypothetical protein